MFMHNVLTFYRIKRGVEPESIVHLLSVPEEEPEVFVFEVKYENDVSNWAVNITEQGLIVREIENQEELETIKQMKPSSRIEEDVETL
jgi:hypothetical protein